MILLNNLQFKLFILPLFVGMLGGCAEYVPVPLVYDAPIANKSRGCLVVAINPIIDLRNNKEIDNYISGAITDSVRISIRSEVRSFKNVETVMFANSNIKSKKQYDFLVNAKLKAFGATVPDQGSRTTSIVMGTIVFGGLGGVVAGSVDTQVHGYSEIDVRILNTRTTNTVERLFRGKSIHSVAARYMDKPQSKSRASGLALKQALTGLRSLWSEIGKNGPSGREPKEPHKCSPPT